MLAELSLFCCFCHVYIPFIMLYDLRGNKKRATIISALFIGILTTLNMLLMFYAGIASIARLFVITRSVPAFIFFFFLVEDRSWRYVFTFCLVDTATLWIILFSGMLDRLLGCNSAFQLVFRLLIMPALEYITWRYLRKPYRELLRNIEQGWGAIAAISALIYVLFACMPPLAFMKTSWRPWAPIIILILILVPLTYVIMLWMLMQQRRAHLEKERQGFLQAQIDMMERRVEEIRQAEEKIRIERHDLRHRLDTVAALVEKEERAEALDYLAAARLALDETKTRKYCRNVVLDAILSLYFNLAKQADITVESRMAIPDTLPVDAAELSTVFANALENSIKACKELPPEKRKIICTCITDPCFMFEIANPCKDTVIFGSGGLPLTEKDSHGIGTRSIMAFAEKHDAVCRFYYKDGWFHVQMTLQNT